MNISWTQSDLEEYHARMKKARLEIGQDSGGEELESTLQKKIMAYLKDKGYYYFHDHSRGKNKAGHPDLIIALPDSRTLWLN